MTPALSYLTRRFVEVWSPTAFRSTQLAEYAEESIVSDTRRGLLGMSALAIALVVAESVLFAQLGLSAPYFYTSAMLIALAVHMIVSARAVSDIKTLHVLGMTMLVVSALAFVLLAHRGGGLNLPLFASIALLFTLVPMMPWGVREAAVVTMLIYVLCTVSTGSAEGRFSANELITLQFVMLGASLVSLTLVARNVSVRKRDLSARFALSEANDRIEQLSRTDPLTGAGNRRQLQADFDRLVPQWRAAGRSWQFAFVDLDDFKTVNDTYGHDVGDQLLRETSEALARAVGDDGSVARLGGDEFGVLAALEPDGQPLVGALENALDHMGRFLRHRAKVRPGFSVGIVCVPCASVQKASRVYKLADLALYEAKRAKGTGDSLVNLVRRTL